MSDQDIRVEITGTAEDLRRATSSAIRDIRNVAQETRRADAQMVVSNEAASRSLQNLEKRQAGVAQSSRNFGQILQTIGWSAAIAGVGPLTAGVADLGAAAAGAGVALAPLAGLAATLPNVLGAAGQAGIVATLAFRGMDKALAGDQKALDALSPAAQRFVRTIRSDVGPVIKDLQKQAQAGLLPGVTKGIEDLVKDAPVIKQIVGDTAKELGGLAEQAGKQFSTKTFQDDLKKFGEENVKVIGRLGDAGLHAASGIENITMAAQPLVDDLSRTVDHLTGQADRWIAKQRANGGLAKFFDLTDTRVHQSLDVLGSFASTLVHISTAAQPLAGDLMGGLVKGVHDLADLTGSQQGQHALEGFFTGAERPLEEVGKLVRDLAIDLGNLAGSGQDPLSHLASTLRVDVLPTLSDLAQFLTKDIAPSLTPLIGDLGKLAHDALPGLKAAAPFAKDLAGGAHDLLVGLDKVEKVLPGVTKLLVPLGVFAAVKGAQALPGKIGGEASSLVKSLRGATPANPLFVADVTGGGKGVPGVPGTVAKDAEHAPKGAVNKILEKAVRFSPLTTATAAVVAPAAAVYGGGKLFDSLFGGAKGSDQRTQDFLKQTIKDSPTAADALGKVKDKLKDLHAEEDQATRMGGDDRVTRDYDRQFAALNRFADSLRSAQASTAADFAKMKAAAGSNLSSIRQTVESTTVDIARHLGSDTAQGKDAMIHNLDLAAASVQVSMDKGVISSRTGLAEIRKLFTDALKLYGFDAASAKNLAAHGTTPADLAKVQPGAGGATGGLGQTHGAARGGFFLGDPNARGRDAIPMMVNGKPVMAAEGEYVGIFNRHQMPGLNAALGAQGYKGLPDFLSRNSTPHYAASGGFFPAAGTDYAYGSEPQIAARLDRLGKAQGLHLTGISGHRTPQHSVEVGGFANDPHTRGQASDTPGIEGVTEAVLEKFGLTRPFAGAAEADHIQLLGGGKGGTGAAAAIKRVRFPGGLGALSALGQAGLDRARDAANSALSTAVGSGGGSPTGSGTAAGSEQVRAWAAQALHMTGHFSQANLDALVARVMFESSGNPHAINLTDINAQQGHPSKGLGQTIDSTFEQYRDKSLPDDIYDPIANLVASINYMYGRYGHVVGNTGKGYARGGLIAAAAGALSSRSGIGGAILSTANPVTPDPAKKKKAHKKAKKLVKVRGLPGIPKATRAKSHRGAQAKTKHVSQRFAELMAFPEFQAPSFDSFDQHRDALDAHITEMTGRMDLRSDQQTITLPVAAALAAGLVSQADITKAGLAPDDQIEVVNRDGGVDASDHRFHGGIVAHTNDLAEVIHVRQAIIDLLGGGVNGAGIDTELGRAQFARQGYGGWTVALTKQLDDMRRYYEANVSLRSDLIDQRSSLEHRRPKDWREQVQADHATIKTYERYLNGLTGLPAGFRYDKKAVHDRRAEVQARIKHLQSEVRTLESTKPNVGKKNIDSYARLGRHITAIDTENRALQGHVSGDWDPTAGRAGELSTTITGLRGNVSSIDDVIRQIVVHELPETTLARDGDSQERADWLGTQAPPLPAGTPGGQDSQRADLLQQMLDTSHRQHAIDAAQFATLQAFSPLVNARYLGSFAKGLARVPEDGMAMLHRGEAVIPSPDGPFGTWQAKGGGDVTVELHFADNSGQLVRLIDARVDGRAAKVSSQQLGSRQRLIAAAPGGR